MLSKKIMQDKAKARELLLGNENHIMLILAFVVAIAFCLMPLIACFIMNGVLSEDLLVGIFLILLLLFGVQVFSGIYRMAGLACQIKSYGLTDIFFAFSSIKNYFRVFLVNLIGFFKIVTPFSAGYIIYAVVTGLLSNVNMTDAIVQLIGFLGAVAVAISFLPLCSRFYAVRFLVTAKDYGVIKAVKCSCKYTKGNSMRLIGFNLSVIPLIIVSLAALTIPFALYTFPYLISSYSVICAKLIREHENKIIINETKNDISPVEISSGVEEINEQDS